MGFWNLMIKKDDWILGLVDSLYTFKACFNYKTIRFCQQNNLSPQGKGKKVFIILNGPSAGKQDLTALKSQDIIFVNRGFKHPLYKELNPKFHVFVDPKMMTGEWPLEWLDEIHAMVPSITFVMPVEWAFTERMQLYLKKGYVFYWLKKGKKTRCLGVGGSCFDFAISQNYDSIYFTGFEATGIAHELIKDSSHFYGVNEENLLKNSRDYVQDLYMHSRHLHDLNRLAKKLRKSGIEIYNFTEGGLLDMFPRVSINDLIKLK